jgi:hypothetical protein
MESPAAAHCNEDLSSAISIRRQHRVFNNNTLCKTLSANEQYMEIAEKAMNAENTECSWDKSDSLPTYLI